MTVAETAPAPIGINLHSHLEGSIRVSTAIELATELGISEPDGGWGATLQMRERGTLTTFLWHVAQGYPLLARPDAIRRTVAEAVEDAHADGAAYLELRFGPATHATHGDSIEEVVAAAVEGLNAGVRSTGLPAGMVACALRHHSAATNVAVARGAAAFAGRGVVGFDVAGDELLFPDLHPMREPFAIAAAAGLGLTAHAAEAGPADSVRDAVHLLGVRRIGHGSAVAARADLLDWARQSGICFEVCPTSNVLTGAAASYDRHPVRAFIEAGCDVVVGDDDPTTTHTPLSAEMRNLTDVVGLSADQMRRIHAVSVERAFCDEPTRASIRERMRGMTAAA